MRSFRFWQQWLLWTSVGLVIFGTALAIGKPERVLLPLDTLTNQILWQRPDVPAESRIVYNWLWGIIGATVASWAMLQVFVAAGPFQRRERWSWWAILAGMVIWYPVDTAISWQCGIWPNVLFNTAALISVVLPLAFTWREFFNDDPLYPYAA